MAAAVQSRDNFLGHFTAGSNDPVESVAGTFLYLPHDFIETDLFRPVEYGPEDTLIPEILPVSTAIW